MGIRPDPKERENRCEQCQLPREIWKTILGRHPASARSRVSRSRWKKTSAPILRARALSRHGASGARYYSTTRPAMREITAPMSEVRDHSFPPIHFLLLLFINFATPHYRSIRLGSICRITHSPVSHILKVAREEHGRGRIVFLIFQ